MYFPQEKSPTTLHRQTALHGLNLTRKEGQWAAQRGRRSKSFQDHGGSGGFRLELPLPVPSKPRGSHTALQFRREDKADTEHGPSSLCRAAAGQAAGGLWCPPRSQSLSEPLCGAPRGRCAGPGPWEGGTGWGRTVLGHQQEWQSPLSDPEGTLPGLACSSSLSTRQQPTRPPWSSQDGASKHTWTK